MKKNNKIMCLNTFKKSIFYHLLFFILLSGIIIKQSRATVGDYIFFTKINIIQNSSRAKTVIDDEEIIVNKTYDNVSLNFGYDVDYYDEKEKNPFEWKVLLEGTQGSIYED